ncbi:high mobility group nucleosome-binding domain-containing protein 4 isoform X1 [Erinaceus europaeus]|uniref:High mobility group nucleosome-binding domain-containing protein 4 isoform X1 n=1 Tax=Erinaceus europaeus TaxID=9365 RepID=A0ABM3X8U8_ERIEU|nr:high mobility group nucleosome-binding domain-containing protein 4 isoform X1 [Erinaceus europaeus]
MPDLPITASFSIDRDKEKNTDIRERAEMNGMVPPSDFINIYPPLRGCMRGASGAMDNASDYGSEDSRDRNKSPGWERPAPEAHPPWRGAFQLPQGPLTLRSSAPALRALQSPRRRTAAGRDIKQQKKERVERHHSTTALLPVKCKPCRHSTTCTQ